MDDPLTNGGNSTPCGILEVGDPLEGGPNYGSTHYVLHNFHLQPAGRSVHRLLRCAAEHFRQQLVQFQNFPYHPDLSGWLLVFRWPNETRPRKGRVFCWGKAAVSLELLGSGFLLVIGNSILRPQRSADTTAGSEQRALTLPLMTFGWGSRPGLGLRLRHRALGVFLDFGAQTGHVECTGSGNTREERGEGDGNGGHAQHGLQ